MIVRSTLALISPSSWKTLIRWWVHYRFDKVTQSGGPTPAWLAPCIKFLHQIMSMKQRQELDVHKKPEPYPLTQNSIPNLRLFPPIWVPLLNCLIFCAIQTCLDPLGVWSRKHEASKLLSMFADYISKRESQDPLMIMLGGWMNAAQTVATTHSEGVWGPENPRAGCARWRAVTLWQSYLDADMHTSTSLQLITASIDTTPINSPNGTHGDMKNNERRLPWHSYRWWCPAIYHCSKKWSTSSFVANNEGRSREWWYWWVGPGGWGQPLELHNVCEWSYRWKGMRGRT